MKLNKIIFAILILCSCNKIDGDLIGSGVPNSELTDTVKIPINDLGTGTYLGFTGGLYPDGSNKPKGQYKNDLNDFCKAIKPLNESGAVDSVTGKIVFISLGGSTSSHMIRVLKGKTRYDHNTNPFLELIDCSDGHGTASFQNISNPDDHYWNVITKALDKKNIVPDQVQIIYVESEDSLQVVSFPERPQQAASDIEAAMRTCKVKLSNLKLVYFLGRTTTFPGHGLQQVTNIEPCPYYNGWATKLAIEDQINGVPGTEYAVCPLMTWGWYQWADGTSIPRQDGFNWQDSDTVDGLHATDAGEDTLSNRFKNFLLTDRFASIWYKKK